MDVCNHKDPPPPPPLKKMDREFTAELKNMHITFYYKDYNYKVGRIKCERS